MSSLLILFIALGFFIFGFLTMLIVADNEDGFMQRAIVSGLLSSILFFVIIEIYIF
ncbi:MAG: hypothetical protein HOF44_01045 [Pelagibacterales bacterium]|jgi:hypothetical protein|nr:hypothetical protein [Pelagibacterales bacterium]